MVAKTKKKVSPADDNMPPDFVPPNMSNATAGMCVDELGRAKAWKSYFEKVEAFYKEAFKARAEGQTLVEGDKFQASIEVAPRSFLITELVEKQLSKKKLAECYRTQDVTTVRVTKLG